MTRHRPNTRTSAEPALTQYSLFGAASVPLGSADLDGLLLAGGQWVRSSAGARLSIRVADRWRADALAAAFGELGLDGLDTVVAATTGLGVRTRFDTVLESAAARWTRGARTVVPADFALTAGGLRLWTIAAGSADEAGHLLATVPADDPLHRIAGSALVRLGVPAAALTRRGGAGWRVSSARRLRRLVELVGPAPQGCGADWPAVRAGVPPLADR